jgi:uncharacterized protein (TIGR00369 family)
MAGRTLKIRLEDDGYCFVCGKRNPIGLGLDFSFDGETIKTEFVPRKEHQGYMDIVHGGIISTLLDEAMVKLAIAMKMPAVTAHIEVRLRRPARVGERIKVSAEVLKKTGRVIQAYAKAVTDRAVIADARGKLVRVPMSDT